MKWAQDNAEALTAIAGGAAAAWGALVAYKKRVHPWVMRMLRSPYVLDRIEARQAEFAKELQFNGGSSIKDMVAAVQRSQTDMAAEIALVRGIQRALTSQNATPVYETDAQGRCVFVNNAYLELLGCQLADVLVNGWGSFVAPADRMSVTQEWAACMSQDRDFDMRYRVIGEDQQLYKVRGRARRVKDQQGRTVAWAGTWSEITPTGVKVDLAPAHS